ncbi:MAG: type II secretion system major pseudopilin GspG [Planctomycetota bacterium]|nr:type II secretion system major pseudopilin GspG [Planctomycetota bacterium]
MTTKRDPFTTQTRQAFTLMEVLLVLVILAVLGSTTLVYYRGIQQKAMQDTARTQIGIFKEAIELFQINVNSYPTSEQGLNALLTAPADLPNPEKWGTTPYLAAVKIPLDPWGRDYNYELRTENNYRIWCYGPDGVDGNEDDVSTDVK